MNDKREPTTTRPPEVSEAELQKEYLRILLTMVENHGAVSREVNAQLHEFALNPNAKIGLGLIDIIKTLCDCKAIIVILECLCKWLTGSRLADTSRAESH